jgi:hypothetical protein
MITLSRILSSTKSASALALAASFLAYSPANAQSLGAAASSAIQASAGVTAAGGAGTSVNGEVGASPTASITGFPPAVVVPPFTLHLNDGYAVAAQAAVDALFVSLGNGACNTSPTTQMNSATFTPGIHCFGAGTPADLSTGGTVTLNGAGTYIFRVGSALTANTGSNIILTGGANACNVFWQVGSSATLNGVTFPGNVVAQASVNLGTGMNLTGRALARTASVTLAGSNTVGGCSNPPPPPVCPTITLSPASLPNGTLAVAYNQTISASGGVAPHTFTVTSGALPTGLTLTPGGVLAGTPTVAGSFTFTVRGTDANGCFGTQSYTIVIGSGPAPPPVCPTVTLSPASLPNGTVAIAYNQTISATGGTAPYSFGVISGALPTGLTLTPGGVLAGTPTVAGSFTFTVRGTDANGCFGTQVYTLVIAAAPPPPPGCPALTVAPASLPGGTVAVAYSQSITATGGTAPYSFGVTAGIVPPGLTLSPVGLLAGTPTTSGTSGFTVRATDANGCFAERFYSLVIAAAPAPPPGCPAITLTPTTLPAGAIAIPYSQTLTASGGTAPYSFGLTTGALPAGLTLSPTGILAGTPTVAGTSSFTIRATDANGCFLERSYSINIPGPPPVPTLSEWALIGLALILGLAGYVGLRGQNASLRG